MLENTFTLHTNGRGYWSSKATAVTVEALDLQYCTPDKDFGELCVHFNTNDWDTATDGLYTQTNCLCPSYVLTCKQSVLLKRKLTM